MFESIDRNLCDVISLGTLKMLSKDAVIGYNENKMLHDKIHRNDTPLTYLSEYLNVTHRSDLHCKLLADILPYVLPSCTHAGFRQIFHTRFHSHHLHSSLFLPCICQCRSPSVLVCVHHFPPHPSPAL